MSAKLPLRCSVRVPLSRLALGNTAGKLGIKTWHEDGSIKFEGRLSEIRRLWAVCGADLISEGETAWACYMGGDYMGRILTDGGWAYSYTIAVGD